MFLHFNTQKRPNAEPRGVPERSQSVHAVANEILGNRFLHFVCNKTQKRPNTEPQGVPEALDRFIR